MAIIQAVSVYILKGLNLQQLCVVNEYIYWQMLLAYYWVETGNAEELWQLFEINKLADLVVLIKSQFILYLFQQWSRRYFVLYAPPASTMLPGMCSAVLDYYDNERQLFKKGTIDLTNCIQVSAHPQAEFYQHVFSLRTKHRGSDRTYYLVSDTESDMMHWVECLRAVLFLDGGCKPWTSCSVIACLVWVAQTCHFNSYLPSKSGLIILINLNLHFLVTKVTQYQ